MGRGHQQRGPAQLGDSGSVCRPPPLRTVHCRRVKEPESGKRGLSGSSCKGAAGFGWQAPGEPASGPSPWQPAAAGFPGRGAGSCVPGRSPGQVQRQAGARCRLRFGAINSSSAETRREELRGLGLLRPGAMLLQQPHPPAPRALQPRGTCCWGKARLPRSQDE